MKRTFAMAVLLAVTAAGFVVTGGAAQAAAKTTVSRTQYNIMIRQCRYADSRTLRRQCRMAVRKHYRVGRWNPNLDCRTYSGITVCGTLKLSRRERLCVKHLAQDGLSRRRAEVECYVFA
ncbi:MAG: hypothetical protein JWQ95_2784 [Sphaerisporangium sp.]|jgi:hypothetical protein|nr:hypothetical protein [Sphaerisporangium sp.]